MTHPVGKCESCQAPIITAWNAKTGAPAPIDAEPGKGGFVHLHGFDPAHPLFTVLTVKQVATKDQSKLYTSHLKTCKNAKRTRARTS